MNWMTKLIVTSQNTYVIILILNLSETQEGIGKFGKLHVTHHNFSH